jgi:hypothetical protein
LGSVNPSQSLHADISDNDCLDGGFGLSTPMLHGAASGASGEYCLC